MQRLESLYEKLRILNEKDHEDKAIDLITPEPNPIQSRTWYAQGNLATKYSFSINHTTPITKVIKSSVTSRIDFLGMVFSGEYSEEFKDNMNLGNYSVKYTPCWWGMVEKILVQPFVASKDHSDTLNEKKESIWKLGFTPAIRESIIFIHMDYVFRLQELTMT